MAQNVAVARCPWQEFSIGDGALQKLSQGAVSGLRKEVLSVEICDPLPKFRKTSGRTFFIANAVWANSRRVVVLRGQARHKFRFPAKISRSPLKSARLRPSGTS